MSSLNPPLTKEDFINSGWKEVIDNSSKDCFSYYLAFSTKAKKAQEAENIKEQAVFEILAFVTDAEIQPESTKKSFPEVFQRLTDEHLNFLAEIVDEVSDPELKARVADILWLRRGKIDMAKKAIDAYLEPITELEDPIMLLRLAKIERALRLGLSINDHDRIKKVVAHIEKIIDHCNEKDPWGVLTNLIEILQEKKLQEQNFFDPIKYEDLAEEWAKQAELDHDWYGARRYWEIKAEWHRIGKNVEKAHRARISAAETYIKEAEDSLTKHPTPYLKASHDLQKAFEAFERLKSQCTEEERGKINTKLEEIHKLLLECQQKSPNELIIISSEFNISEEVEFAISKVKGKEFPEAILALAFLVTPPEISYQIVEENGLSGLFPKAKINEMGKVVAHQSSNKQEESATYQKIYALAFIEPARKQIILEHLTQKSKDQKIKETYLLPLVSNNPFVPPGREKLFIKGLYAGLIGDFVTSTHILIPQIENSVRYILWQKQSVITSKLEKGIQHEYDLNKMLYLPEISSIFDDNTLFDLKGFKGLLVEDPSNLRNRMAHGLINDNEFSSTVRRK